MNENVEHDNGFEDDIERAVEDKHDGVLAADATGMIRGEEEIRLVELDDEDLDADVAAGT